MNNIWKRGLSLFLAVVMVMGAVPMSVFATEEIVEETSAPAEQIQEEAVVAEETTEATVEETSASTEHVHDYVGTVIVEATCGAYGTMHYACDCGDAYEDVIPATGEHQWDEGVVTQEATDEEDGEITYTCTLCGAVKMETISVLEGKEALGAEYGTKETPYGIVWVKGRDAKGNERDAETIGMELVAYDSTLQESSLRKNVLVSIGRAADVANKSVKVLFEGVDAGNLFALMSKQEELINAFKGDENTRAVKFNVNGDDYWLGIKKVEGATVEVVNYTIENPGVPTDLNAQVQAKVSAALNQTPAIKHNSKNWYAETALRSGAVTVSGLEFNAVWPGYGQENTYNIAAATLHGTQGDVEKTAYIKLTLKDTTEPFKVTYANIKTDAEPTSETIGVYPGGTVPYKVFAHKYYKFEGWKLGDTLYTNAKAALYTNVQSDMTFIAVWTPGIDGDGDGTDDREQKFTITYVDENGNEYPGYTKKLPYGEKLNHPTPVRSGYKFLYWEAIAGVDSATVTGNVTYKAVWAEEAKPVFKVTYMIEDLETGDDVAVVKLVESGNPAPAMPDSYAGDGNAYLGWYVADANGIVAKVDGVLPQASRYDFADTSNTVTGDLYLRMIYGPDEDSDGHIDGEYMYNADGSLLGGKKQIDTVEIYQFRSHHPKNDYVIVTKKNENKDNDSNGLIFDDNTTIADIAIYDLEGNLFAGWVESTVVNEYKTVHTYKAKFAADANGNGVFDNNERAKIVVEDKTLDDVSVTVNGASYNGGIFLFDSKAGVEVAVSASEGFCITGVVGVRAKDNKNMTAVSEIGNNGLTVTLKDADAAADPLGDAEFTHTITVKTADIMAKEIAPGEAHLTIQKGSAHKFTVEEIYDAVMETPKRVVNRAVDTATISMEYIARPEQKDVEVNVDALYDWMESNYSTMLTSILDTALGTTVKNGHRVITIAKVNEVKQDVASNQDVEMVLTAQDMTNVTINDFITKFVTTLKNKDATDGDLSKLVNDLMFLKNTIAENIEEYADIRPFAYDINGNAAFTETVTISYSSEMCSFVKEVKVELADKRDPAGLSAAAATVTYGASENTILKNVTAASSAVKNNLEMPVVFKQAAAYKVVTAAFVGDENYRPGRVSFDLTIKRMDMDMNVDSILVKMDNEEDLKNYNPAPNAPADAEIVSVIAGFDMNGVDLGLGTKENPGTADNLNLKIWVKVPGTLKNLLNVVKQMADLLAEGETAEYIKKLSLNDQHFDTWEEAIAEIEKMMDLANVQEAQVTTVLNWIKNQTHLSGGVDLMFSDSYPTAPGVYVSGAIEVDNNYDEALTQEKLDDNVGIIAISPMLVKPNQGGVQLYHKNDGAENIYEDHSNGQPFELFVKHNGTTVDADVYYYGFDNSLSVHFYCEHGVHEDGMCAPSAPGVYLASTVYRNGGKYVGSDIALIVIGVELTETTVMGKTIVADGEKHTLDILVREDPDNSGKIVNPGKTIISGYIGNDAEEASAGLAALKAEINIDFPETLDKLWNNKFIPNFKEYTGVELPSSIKVSHVVKFLEKCLEWNDAQALENILNNLPGIDETITDKFPNAFAERVINELLTVTRKLDGTLEVTFHDTYKNGNLNFGYSEYGVYAYYVVVTDPNYVPSSDTGLLILKNGEFAVLDTVHPYTGDAYLPSIVDGSNRDEFMMVSGIFNGEKAINFILDDDLKTLVDNKYGRAIDGMTVGELRDKATGKANALSTAIVEAIIEKEKAYLAGHFPTGSEELAEALKILNDRESKFKTKMISKLTEKIIAQSSMIETENDVILLNEPIVDVGVYDVLAFSYALAYDYGTLTIAPVYPRIAADHLSKERGTADPKLTWTMTYYSYLTAEDGTLTEISMDLPASVTVDVDAKLVREPGEEIGTYAVNFESVTFNGPDFMPDEIKPEDIIPGTLTITEPAITGEIKAASASLRLKSEVHINVAFDIDGFDGLENIEDKMGLLIWHDKSIPMDECDITNAHEIIRGGEFHTGYNKYVVRTNGISAKNMGNLDGRIFFKIFIQTGEDSYVYSPRYGYSPQQYCENKVSGNHPEDLKAMCVALMNYGAKAQVYFAEKGEYTLPATLMNDVACFKDYQSKLKTYSDSMVDALADADKSKHVNFKADTTMISKVQSFMSTTGALQLNFYTTVLNKNYTEAGVLVWPEDAYNSADVLTWDNATKIPSGAVGAENFESRFTGIAAKDMGKTVFGCSYIKVDGEYKYYGIYKNSIDAYAKSMLGKPESTAALKDLMKATVVYGEYAKTYFANNADNSN